MYGKLPSEIMRLDPADLSFDLACMQQAHATFAQELGRAKGVIPVLPLEM